MESLTINCERNARAPGVFTVSAQIAIPAGGRPGNGGSGTVWLVGVVDRLPWISVERKHIGMRAGIEVGQIRITDLAAPVVVKEKRVRPIRANGVEPIHQAGPGRGIVQVPFVPELQREQLAEKRCFVAARSEERRV